MHDAVERLSRVLALLGGVVLFALVLLTCISVLGRGGNTLGHSEFLTTLAPGLAAALIDAGVKPVTGDYELVEAGIAFAIFAFFPWCQMRQGHARVDVFTAFLPLRANLAIAAFWEVLFALALILIAWRLGIGTQVIAGRGETTFMLQFPIWWAYAASFAAAVAAALVASYVALRRLQGAALGREVLPVESEALR